ncbi:translocation/assembly module TamB domain-containing protein [Silvanigrella sp.]|uniref:translocation/assembly module TamB domain-containing protein n=1 Tax=Silvanigrella sp. TaxID=2024976 RepID=UPI0037C7A5C0
MIKFLKRVIIFLIVSFISFNAVVFFVLNSQTVQHAIVEYININYFNKQKLELGLGSLSLNFLSGSLNLNEVYIKEKEKKDDSLKEFKLSLNQLTISFDVFSSYIKRMPVVQKIILRGSDLNLSYDSSNKLIIPEFLNINKNDNEDIDIPKLIQENMNHIPFEIEAINLKFSLGSKEQKNYQKITISHLELKKSVNQKGLPALKSNILLTDSEIIFPWLHDRVSINLLDINLLIASDGSFLIEKLELKSNLAELHTDLRGIISSNILDSTYVANVKKLDLNSKEVFHLLEMSSSGRAVLSGIVISGKKITDEPIFNGRIKWNDFKLKQFDIYSGEADLYFKDRTINYSNAKIKTLKEGKILAKGIFQLYDKFYFENKAELIKFSFAELIHGLGVPFTPIEFLMNSKEMLVSGYILSPDHKKVFELFANGKGSASNMIVTSFPDQVGRDPIPNIDFDLNLTASVLGLVMDNTKAYITKAKLGDQGEVDIKKGFIDFTQDKGIAVNTNLIGSQINLSVLNYFLKFKTTGIGSFTGDVTVKPGSTDVVFEGEAEANDGEMFGLKFHNYKGKLGLNSIGVLAKDSIIVLSDSDKLKFLNIYLKEANVEYNNLNSKIVAYSDAADLSVLSYSSSYWLNSVFHNSSGKINKLSVNMSGLLLHLSTWNLNLNSEVDNLKLINGEVKKSKINLNCISGVCSNSLLSFTGLKEKNNAEESSSSLPFVLIELIRFSFDDAVFRAKFNNVPLGMFSNDKDKKIQGSLNSNIQMTGKWDNLGGYMNSQVYRFKYNDFHIGDFSFNAYPNDQKQIIFDLKSFSIQLLIKYIMPNNIQGQSFLNIDLLDFDATAFLTEELRAQYGLFSQFSASIKMNGQTPFHSFHDMNWIHNWKGQGIIESGNLQLGKMLFELSNNNEISFDGKELKLAPLSFNGQLGKFEIGKSNINFFENHINTSIYINASLNKVDQMADFFGPSEGILNGQFNINGKLNDIKTTGELVLDAKVLSLKNYQPAFTNLYGRLEFNGNKLELNTFNAAKGTGTVNGAGSIDFSTLFKENPESPNLFFKFSARNADLRLQIPIFQLVDTNFDADILFSGNEKPYSISGDVNFKKLRIFKDIGCSEIANQIIAITNNVNPQLASNNPFASFNVNFQGINSLIMQTQCVRGRFSTSPSVNLSGDSSNPVLVGNFTTDSANLFLLKSRFEVKRGDFNFIEMQKYDPNIDIQMESRIASYTITATLNGRFSHPKIDLSILPPNLPNGDRMNQTDIISIISTGQIPTQSSSGNLLSASTSVFSFFGGGVADLGFLNNTLSTVTGGLVDNINVVPISQNGQYSWRATASRSVTERINLGVSYQAPTGDAGPSQIIYANYFLNDVISLFSSYSLTNPSVTTQQQSRDDLTGGLRFRFGSQ